MRFSKRITQFDEAVFAFLSDAKADLLRSGRPVYDLSIGTPDGPPAPHIVEALVSAASDTRNYRYAIKDTHELLEAAAQWYKRRFDVSLDPQSEITSLLGSQDGLAHISLAMVDPGDVVLVPDPGYPIFRTGPMLCGAEIHTMPQRRENGYIINVDDIPGDVARKARLMIISYPNNPVAAIADDSFYKRVIEFAHKHDIVVLHDNAYCELVFDGARCGSFLKYDGARDIGVEFNSLSKTYNMSGCRVGFALGNAEIIKKLAVIKSNIDYGMFLPVQRAAIAAITGPQQGVHETCMLYQHRRDTLTDGLKSIGWDVPKSPGTMFIWAPLPKGYTSSMEFSLELMKRTGVMVVPGSSFGPAGEGHVRIALVQNETVLREAVAAMAESDMLR